jgi:hypothetical protein
MRALHVFKREYAGPKLHYLGSVKDIRARTEFFRERGHHCDELLVSYKTDYDQELRNVCPDEWGRYDVVLLEATYSPGALRYIRRIAPRVLLLVRSHNAELLHRCHWALANGFRRSSIDFLVQALRNCRMDQLSGRSADCILSIDNWETRHYWQRLLPAQKAVWVPFFLPMDYRAELEPKDGKENLCVHFGASLENPLIADATLNFVGMVDRVAPRLRGWRFVATGACTNRSRCGSNAIHWTGLLDRPYDELNRAKAMALLSPYGFGFKTKILEAVTAKAFVILPHALYRRLPDQLLPYCIPIDHRREDDFVNALRRCERPFPEGNPNEEFRRIAFEQMDSILMRARHSA